MRFVVLADLTLLVHALFVLWVIFGGLAVWRWRRLVWLHIPAVVWGVVIEWGGCVCPLTYLENHFLRQGSGAGYGETCIEHYLAPVLYPLGLTREAQILVALVALMVNVIVYLRLWVCIRNSN